MAVGVSGALGRVGQLRPFSTAPLLGSSGGVTGGGGGLEAFKYAVVGFGLAAGLIALGFLQARSRRGMPRSVTLINSAQR